MNRNSVRGHRARSAGLLLIGLGFCLLAAGCEQATTSGSNGVTTGKDTPPPKTAQKKDSKAGGGAKAPPPAKAAGYLQGWEKPAATLVLSGEINGYLEPCGCSLKQSGGFARRAQLLSELDKKGWAYAGLDVGGTLKKANRQDEIKFESILAGMQLMHYAGLALGREELLLRPDFLYAQPADDPNAVKLLSANVLFFDDPSLGVPVPWQLVEVGGVKIGVTAVLGLSHKDEVSPPGVVTNITVKDPKDVLPGVIAEMQQEKPDFLVLLSHGTIEEAKALAEEFPQFRIIETAGGPDEASGKPIVVNDTWILEMGRKGRSVGILGYYPDNEQQPFKFELIELDSERFPSHDSMFVVMRNYQQRLQDERIAESDSLKIPHPSSSAFVGVEACAECHRNSYNVWKDTGHAKATETLLHGRAGTKPEHVIPRQFDPECLSCHVTGWHPQGMKRYDSGFFSMEASKHLFGQQCENCHGPASKHTELERAFAENAGSVDKDELKEFRKALHLSVDTAEKKVCLQCHDAENSPDFNYADYWEMVKHPFKD